MSVLSIYLKERILLNVCEPGADNVKSGRNPSARAAIIMHSDAQVAPTGTYANGRVRRYPRTLFSVPITVHYFGRGKARSSHGISLDVSEGGIGALVQVNLPVGETVNIDLSLRNQELCAAAIVRHSSSSRSGFEFIELPPEARMQLHAATTREPLH